MIITIRPPTTPAGSYNTWQTWRAFARHNQRKHTWEAPQPVWKPCPMCWGQRTILSPAQGVTGRFGMYWSETCPHCLGVGDVPSVG